MIPYRRDPSLHQESSGSDKYFQPSGGLVKNNISVRSQMPKGSALVRVVNKQSKAHVHLSSGSCEMSFCLPGRANCLMICTKVDVNFKVPFDMDLGTHSHQTLPSKPQPLLQVVPVHRISWPNSAANGFSLQSKRFFPAPTLLSALSTYGSVSLVAYLPTPLLTISKSVNFFHTKDKQTQEKNQGSNLIHKSLKQTILERNQGSERPIQ